ncbi:MAG: hypothetical protein MK078_17275 [Crocinitomicaceae bacterium]|nr:hypothetical protein [Crocinitomicaceae bacterium]
MIEVIHQLKEKQTDESLVFQHLIWSLIFNASQTKTGLINKYIHFVYEHPHYLKVFDKYDVWIGHEYDIANHIEKIFASEMITTIHEIWCEYKENYKTFHFQSRIGFYVPRNFKTFSNYSMEFIEFCAQIKRRL